MKMRVKMLFYSFKRVMRGWRLFSILFIGIAISTSLFAGTNIATYQIMNGFVNEQLQNIYVDMYGTSTTNFADNTTISQIKSLNHVKYVENFGIDMNIETNISSLAGTPYLVGMEQSSILFNEIRLIKGTKTIGPNETVIPADSTFANNVSVGDTIYLNITWTNQTSSELTYRTYPLKVVGIVALNSTVKDIFEGNFVSREDIFRLPIPIYEEKHDYIIVNFETYRNYENAKLNLTHSEDFTNRVLIWVDRTYYATPYTLSESVSKLTQLNDQIADILASKEYILKSDLLYDLNIMAFSIDFIKIRIVIVMLPIFFMIWYMGTILSELTYNLRRKEIGLLLTKGFEAKRIRKMFLTEAIILGLLAGIVGIFAGQFISTLIDTNPTIFPFSNIGVDTIIITIVVGILFGIFTVYGPAGRASKLNVIDALKQYIYIEEKKPYREKLAKIALLLGTYKIVSWITGFSIIETMLSINFSNILLEIVFIIVILIDALLDYIGPILFFYGFAKIFIQKSMKLNNKIESFASHIYGEFGKLASKNISRNTARNASIAFILALIIGYSVSSTLYSASNLDFMNRSIYADVGSDVRVNLLNPNNMSYALNNISWNTKVIHIAGIYSTLMRTPVSLANVQIVNGSDWVSTAYYENSWFSDNPQDLFSKLDSNRSIILERVIARNLQLNVGDRINIQINRKSINLLVVGFFGPIPHMNKLENTSYYYAQDTWSFISWKTISQILGNDFNMTTAYVLVKLNKLEQSDSFTDTMKKYTSFVQSIKSVKELKDNLLSTFQYRINIQISELVLLFTMFLATIGTFIIIQVSLAEKRREIALISVRGLSIKQMAQMLLAETSIIFILSLALGTFVGTIMAYGTIISQSEILSSLVVERMVFGPDVLGTIGLLIGVILLCMIVPVLFVARKGTKDFETLR